MKKAITVTTVFLMLSTTFAQQKTVEEIYAGYINAIGGSEKLANVVSKKQHIAYYSSVKVSGGGSFTDAAKKFADNPQTVGKLKSGDILGAFGITTTKQDALHLVKELISFTDETNKQYASVSKSPDGSFTRLLTLNGKLYIVNDDGARKEYLSSFNPFEGNFFPETIIHTGSVVMPNEVYKEEEVYVVKYTSSPTKKNNAYDVYEFFSIATGLRVATKRSIFITEYEDYKEANGILVPHKTISYDEEGKKKTEDIILNVQFNIDADDFKQNCFQQPEACFEKN